MLHRKSWKNLFVSTYYHANMHHYGLCGNTTAKTYKHVQMQSMFPPTMRPGLLSNYPQMLQLLKAMHVKETVIQTLKEVGLSIPQFIVNVFGLSNKQIMESFLMLGYQFMVD